MSEPIISAELFDKAMAMGEEMQKAVLNPNTDFMTKLLFDARFLSKKFGKSQNHWSQAIFSLKMALHGKALSEGEVAKSLGLAKPEVTELLSYLKNMSEIAWQGGKYSLNYTNQFSKPFGR